MSDVYPNNELTEVAERLIHDMRTPVAAIISGAGGIKEYVLQLIQAYSQAHAHGIDVPNIDTTLLAQLPKVLDYIESEGSHLNVLIDQFQDTLKTLSEGNGEKI